MDKEYITKDDLRWYFSMIHENIEKQKLKADPEDKVSAFKYSCMLNTIERVQEDIESMDFYKFEKHSAGK